MNLQMGCINHQLIGLFTLCSQCYEYLVEHAHPASSDEAVVDRFVRAILGRRIASAQAVPDHEDNGAGASRAIDPEYPMRQREIRLNPAHLRLLKPAQITQSFFRDQTRNIRHDQG